MHTLNRVLTALMVLMVLVPPATFALVSVNQREAAQESLQTAISSAVYTYSRQGTLNSIIGKGQKLKDKGGSHLRELELQKMDIRHQIVVQRGVIDFVSKKYHIQLTGSGVVATLIKEEERRLVRMVRANYFGQSIASISASKKVVMDALNNAVSGGTPSVDADVQQAQMRFLADLKAVQRAFHTLPVLEKKRDEILKQYRSADKDFTTGETLVQRSNDELAEIQRITMDVHDQVLKMQGELARIDAKLRSKAERALIEKGLLDPSMIAQNQKLMNASPGFHWPVYGRVSAGFMEASYKKFFGVPHLGMDIVVPQSSPVYSAADGVVFLVRDGGLKGYSYILIGHRGGYATLYGHVSQALVVSGQDVSAGQEIALSGGAVGKHGSGPMTTAAHLHFEVIRAGVNVNPRSVLP